MLSLQGKTGIVGDDEYASWEFRTMVSFLLMSCQVTGKVPNMMSWVIFVNFLCINRAGFVQDSICVLILEE